MKNNIINKMHIQEPADKLAKTVGKPLKFDLGIGKQRFLLNQQNTETY